MSNSPIHKRNTGQRQHDYQIISRMYLKGHSQKDIAKHISDIRPYTLTQQQISKDLKVIRRYWRQSSLIDINEATNRELDRIDALEEEAWQAWRRSHDDGEVTISEQTTGSEGTRTKASIRKTKNKGNKSFLDTVAWCIDKRLKIFGIESATKIELSLAERIEKHGIDSSDIFNSIIEHKANEEAE